MRLIWIVSLLILLTSCKQSSIDKQSDEKENVESRKSFLDKLPSISDFDKDKILSIGQKKTKEIVPQNFKLFGIIIACIPVFIIYVLILLKRSNLKNKWYKYLMVILLNYPTFKYGLISGFSMGFLEYNLLFGIGFQITNYIDFVWLFSIPIGALFWFYKLKLEKQQI